MTSMSNMISENSQENLMGADVKENEDDNNDNSNGDPTNSAPVTADNTAAGATSTPGVKKREHKKRKASKGRFKKLWRRAVGPPPGITSRSEWLELMELHSEWKLSHTAGDGDQKGEGGEDVKDIGGGGMSPDQEAMLGPLPGPSILLATQKSHDFSDLENWQMTEGTDHRDVLMNLLFSEGDIDHSQNSTTQQKKKKKKSSPAPVKDDNSGGHNQVERQASSLDNTPPLPSWSNVGNLGSVGGVALIEIEITGGERDTPCILMPSQRIMDAMKESTENVWSSLLHQPNPSSDPKDENDDNSRVKRTIGAACKIKLFQGNKQPRCLSETIMFVPPPAGSAKKPKNGCADLNHALNEMLMRPKQLRSEGFPTEANVALTITSKASDETEDATMAVERVHKISEKAVSVTDVQNATEYDALELVVALSVSADLGHTTEEDNVTDKSDEFSKVEHYVRSVSLDRAVVSNEPNGESQKMAQQPKVFALDCEMVETPAGPELARVSVIMTTGGSSENGKSDTKEDEKYIVVLDELVKPRRKVLDYLTEYSGIKPKMLVGVGTRIEHIQVLLLSLIDKNDILVGHSLENDLRALRFVHTKIVDTSIVFRGNNGRKFSLRHLSSVLLQKKIQQGCGTSGHCSTEDAEASLILALRRARRGSAFGLKENGRRQNILTLFQRINREAKDQSKEAQEAGSFAERNDGSCVCIGPNDWITKYAQSNQGAHHVLTCESLMNSMAMAAPSWLSSDKSSKRAGFLWANLSCEGRFLGGKGRWTNEVNKLDEIVRALVDRVPNNIPILLVFQQNYKKALALTQQRRAALNPKATCAWTSVQEDEWAQYMEQSKVGEAIWIGSACPSASP